MAKKFSISLDGDKFDSTKPDTADKIVKLLCDRGMVDPFDDNPKEVAGSKQWVQEAINVNSFLILLILYIVYPFMVVYFIC